MNGNDLRALTEVAAHIRGPEGPSNRVVIVRAVIDAGVLGIDITVSDGHRAAIIRGGRIAQRRDIVRVLAIDRDVGRAGIDARVGHVMNRDHLRAFTEVAAHIRGPEGPGNRVVIVRTIIDTGVLGADIAVSDGHRAAVVGRRGITQGRDVGQILAIDRHIRRAGIDARIGHVMDGNDLRALAEVAAHIGGPEGPSDRVVVMSAIIDAGILGTDVTVSDGHRAAIIRGSRITQGRDVG